MPRSTRGLPGIGCGTSLTWPAGGAAVWGTRGNPSRCTGAPRCGVPPRWVRCPTILRSRRPPAAVISVGRVRIVLGAAHRAEVRDERIEVGVGELGVGRHLPVAKGRRVADVGLDLRDRPVLDDAPRHVQVRADVPALAVDRVAGDALAAEQLESLPGRRAARDARRDDVRVLLAEIDDLELGDLPRPGTGQAVAL